MCADMSDWQYNNIHDFPVYIAGVHAYFHAKIWGEILIDYVVDNSIMFKREFRSIRSNQISLPEELSEDEVRKRGWTETGMTMKFIPKRSDPRDFQPFSNYTYQDRAHVETDDLKYTWDLESNSVTAGWKYNPGKDENLLSSNQMLLLSAVTSWLDTKEIRQLCALYNLKDHGVLKTYVGYKFDHCASNFLLQRDV